MPEPETGYPQALAIVLDSISPLGRHPFALPECLGHAAAEDILAQVDAPSDDASLMDGYAFSLSDLKENANRLTIAGNSAAGQKKIEAVTPGCAMRILTGGRIPPGADTVVAEEHVKADGTKIEPAGPVRKGDNILARGSDITAGTRVVKKGALLTPGIIGLLATAGCENIRVYKKPSVALIATGDEIRLPGHPLSSGQLYASNIITVDGWCRRYGISTSLSVSKDDPKELETCLTSALENHDAVITSGGAWTGDKDLTANTLERLGWKKYFHRVRLGPGKAAGFGLWNEKPVFILPGGPPSSIVAFLTLALPGLLKLSGFENQGLPAVQATLARPVASRPDWTHAEYGTFKTSESKIEFHPIGRKESRLKSIAAAQGLLLIPEGKATVDKGQQVRVLDLRM
jgi:molybdopterin molybdotransferase